MKVFRAHQGKITALDIPTSIGNNGLDIAITVDYGTPSAVTNSINLRKDIAESIIASLAIGMQLNDPQKVDPVFTVQP